MHVVVFPRERRAFQYLQGIFVTTGMEQRPRVGNAQPRMQLANLVRNSREPTHQQAGVTVLHQFVDMQHQLRGGFIQQIGGEQMLKGLDRLAVGETPARCMAT
ncbi:hypothetical protein D3C87_1302550 [compost metagenome]